MSKISILYKRIQFCKAFGASWKDTLLLIRLTLDYIVTVRSKTRRYQMQFDNHIYKINVVYRDKTFPLHFRRQDLSMLYEVWMDESYSLNTKQVDQSGNILDIGAHIGFTSLYYWTLLGDNHNYICIEGSSKNAKILKSNIKSIPQHTLYQQVLTSDARQIRFYDEMSGHLHRVHNTLGNLQKSTTLNSILSASKNRIITLCKMDIEGMEHEVLTQNNEWLLSVHQLFLELHNPNEYNDIKNSLSQLELFEASTNSSIKHFVRT